MVWLFVYELSGCGFESCCCACAYDFTLFKYIKTYCFVNKLRWLLGLRKLTSSRETEILQIRLILWVTKWKKISLYYGQKKYLIFFIFTNEFIFYSTELFVCTVNFKACVHYYLPNFYFHRMMFQAWKMFFISTKKLFSFLRYSNFSFSVLPSFPPCQTLL